MFWKAEITVFHVCWFTTLLTWIFRTVPRRFRGHGDWSKSGKYHAIEIIITSSSRGVFSKCLMFWKADIMYFSFFGFRTLLTWIFWSGSAKVPQQQGHLRLVENSIWEHHNISFSVRFLICTSYIMLTSIKVFPLAIAPQLDSTLETNLSYRKKCLWVDSTCHLWDHWMFKRYRIIQLK